MKNQNQNQKERTIRVLLSDEEMMAFKSFCINKNKTLKLAMRELIVLLGKNENILESTTND